jgi:poly(A) polymerase
MRERWQQMPADAVRPQLLVTGRELIAAGYIPGAAFKTMLHAAEEAQLEGSIATAVEAMELVRERFGPPSNPAPQAIDPTQN